MHFSESKSTKSQIFTSNFDFTGMAYCRDLIPVPLDLADLKPKIMPLKPFWCIFLSQNQQNVKFLPEILIFQQPAYCRVLKPVPLDSACHLHPKYVPLKPLWCIFPSQNQQKVKFLPQILISQELLIVETWYLCHWIWHTSNPKYVPLKPFWCIFPSQNQQNVKFLPEILI